MFRASLVVGGLLSACLALTGCQTAGPKSIELGRERYGAVIQATSMQQTLANIVRVYSHESPAILDVTEVDATLSFGASVTGAATNIGARRGTSGGTLAGQVGSSGGTVQYSETPTIRYQPLLGQALVAQLVTPVSVDALGLMYDSSWDVGALLDFSAAYITLDYRQFYPALNTIMELTHREALEITAGQSALYEARPAGAAAPEGAPDKAPANVAPGKVKEGGNNALMIYLRPYRRYAGAPNIEENKRILQLWVRLLGIYAGTQPKFAGNPSCTAIGLGALTDAAALKAWDKGIDQYVAGTEAEKASKLDQARRCLPQAIELRVVPLPVSDHDAGLVSFAPVMRTYSAMGILKNATERPGPKVEFVSPEQYRLIRDEAWNQNADALSHYTLLPSDLDSFGCPASRKENGGCDNPLPPDKVATFASGVIETWIKESADPSKSAANAQGGLAGTYPSGLDVYEAPGLSEEQFVDLNGRLGTLRRYLLVIVSDHPPQDPAYVSYNSRGLWYSIAADDVVSQKNFQLLSLFTTMMAVPPTTQPLSPVINVGG